MNEFNKKKKKEKKKKAGICTPLIASASWIIDAKWGLRLEFRSH